MPNLVGPSHYAFFSSLMRRLLWLQRLSEVYRQSGDKAVLTAKDRTSSLFAGTLKRSEQVQGLGIKTPYPLAQLLDDTPADSFLARFSEELCAYEAHFFELIANYHERLTSDVLEQRLNECKTISALWGRELAGERLASLPKAAHLNQTNDFRLPAVFDVIYQYLEGGDHQWKPLLARRITENDVQYELRFCPHLRSGNVTSNQKAKDLACSLESIVYEHFAKFFTNTVSFNRVKAPHSPAPTNYCVDRISSLS